MRAYIIRRALLVIPTVVIASLMIFFILRLIPGDIIDAMAARAMGGSGVRLDRTAIEEALGLDAPLLTQYGRWIGLARNKDGNFSGILQGQLGNSLWKDTPVWDDIAPRWPVTIQLGLMSLIIAQLIAIPIGVYSALRQDTAGDYASRMFATACIAIPSFWLGTVVIVFPSIWWNYMPPITYVSFIENPVKNLEIMILPSIVLGMALTGTTMRLTRSMMLEVLRQDYIRTAWAKGLRERVVIVRHALKNALIPVITMIGILVPIVIGGAVIIEQIFVLPGMGYLIYEAVFRRDYTLVSGILLIFSFVVVVINMLVDVAYGFLDPRIRY